MSDFDSTVLFWTIQNDVLAGLTDVSKSAVNGYESIERCDHLVESHHR
jgi:hypothetical protein